MVNGIALLLGTGVGTGAFLVAWGLRGPARARRDRQAMPAWSQDPRALPWGRIVAAGTASVGVLVVSRWPVLAVAAGAAAWWLSGQETQTQATAIERTEALATWAEMLRDATGTPRGIEGVLVTTASTAPTPIRPIVGRFADRLSYEPLDAALPGLADELDHPLGDQIIASIALSATSGAREIRAVLDDLAAAARDEARMLRRLEVSRERPRSDMRQVIAIVALVIGGLSVAGRDYLQPYDSLGGQVVLAVAAIGWIGGFVWMARLGRVAGPQRFFQKGQIR